MPLIFEPETGYITRGLITYAVDHIHMTLAEAFRHKVNFFDPGYKVGEDLSGWVWSARIDDGPIVYGPTREFVIGAAQPPPPRASHVLKANVGALSPVGRASHHAAAGEMVGVAMAGQPVHRGEAVAFPRSDGDSTDPPHRPDADRVTTIMGALAKCQKVVASRGDEALYAKLTRAWATAHPTGRIILAGKRKVLRRLFEDGGGGTLAPIAGSATYVSSDEDLLWEGFIRLQETRVEGFHLNRRVDGSRIVRRVIVDPNSPDDRRSSAHVLWIVTHPATPEQRGTFEACADANNHVVLFDDNFPGTPARPDRSPWLRAD